MRNSLVAAVVITAFLTWSAAAASARITPLFSYGNGVHDYPIHYDGPMVHHARAPVGKGGALNVDVRWFGGSIQTSTVSYTIFWQPSGTFMSPTYRSLIDRFFSDVGGSDIYGMATPYYGKNGHVKNQSRFGASWTDTTAYPKRVDDRDIQRVVRRAIAANGWPAGMHSQFFVYTAKNAPIAGGGFCAYHSAFNHDEMPAVYAFVPYVGYVNGCDPPFGITPNDDVDADGSILNMSHEQMEMVTDPLPGSGWFDENWGEIGDICIFAFGVPYGDGGANFVVNKHPYFLQEDYSQKLHGCAPNL
ncbi:MAG: hypothetical protein ABI346_05680 [Candidatus Baltobacteraceae bacterium]